MRALRSRTVQADSTRSSQEDAPEKVVLKQKKEKPKKKSKKKKDTSQSSGNNITDNTKENTSPNIKVHKNKKKSRRNNEGSVEFKDIVTSTAKKPPINTRRRRTRISDVNNSVEIKNGSFEATFKNAITSTVAKPKISKPITDITDIINISDSIAEKTDDVLNSTFTKSDNNEDGSILTKNNEDGSILTTNNSGQWKIEEQKTTINTNLKTPPTESKKVFFQEKSLVKSARKKWQRFTRNSQGANSVLEEISTPRKKSPINARTSNVSQKLNKTGTQQQQQSTNKIKPTVMPNFALIHQKAYAKMESISDYSQRKKDRANLLLTASSTKKPLNETNNGNKIKSSRQLFSNEKQAPLAPPQDKKINRFGFKAVVANKQTSIYNREEIVALANKKVQNTNGKMRENKREVLKGVRTNRRFELLMKMRNN